jgi:hypothetical protein
MRYSKVEGNPSLVRDEKTKAIINRNISDYEKYMSLKKSKELESNKIAQIESEMVEIKNDLSEIKDLLRSFLK